MNDEKKKEILGKIECGTFGKEDIMGYMELFVQLANESEDIEYELEGYERQYNFKIDDNINFGIEIKESKLSLKKSFENPDVEFEINGDIAAGIFTGEIDAPQTYIDGKLKLNGPLPDAVKFRLIIDIVREELEDDWS